MVAGNERYLFENPALRKGFVRSLDCEIYRTAEMRCSEAHSAFRRPSFRRRSLLSLSMIQQWPDAIIMTRNDCCPPFCVLIRVTVNAEIFLLLRSFFSLFFFFSLNYVREEIIIKNVARHGLGSGNMVLKEQMQLFHRKNVLFASKGVFIRPILIFFIFLFFFYRFVFDDLISGQVWWTTFWDKILRLFESVLILSIRNFTS